MFKKLVFAVLLIVLVAVVAAPAFGQDAPTVSVSGEPGGLGRYLVAANGMTLYSFKRDTLGVSNCYDRCATAWPPYTVESADGLTAGEGVPGELGTTERTDGTLQVTYNDMPLYFWQNDVEAGDVSGHGVGTNWLVVPPATVYTIGNADHGYILVGPTGMTLYTFDNDEPGVTNCFDQCATNWPPLTVAEAGALSVAINIPGSFGTIDRGDGTLQVTYNGDPLYYWKDDAARGDTTGHAVGDVWWVAQP